MLQQDTIEKEIQTKKLQPKGWKRINYFSLPIFIFIIGLTFFIMDIREGLNSFPTMSFIILSLSVILYFYVEYSHFNYELLFVLKPSQDFSEISYMLSCHKGWRLKYSSKYYCKFEVFVRFSGFYDVTIFIDNNNFYLHTIPTQGEFIYNFGTKRIKKMILAEISQKPNK